jgi:hypothetical protein
MKNKKGPVAFSPHANYTDWAAAFAARGVLSGQSNGSARPLISVF